MEKEYKIFKTKNKTAKENKLLVSQNGNLFDFSLLDTMDIPDREKEAVRDAQKYISPAFREYFYNRQFNKFYCCDGRALFHYKQVYSTKTWKRLYCIYTLAEIEHYRYNRNSVWDEYETETFKTSNGYSQPVIDAEI